MFLREEIGVFPELTEFLIRLLKKRGKDPPLVLTSTPVVVKDVFSKHSPKKGLLSSTAIHVIIVGCIFVLGEYSRMVKKTSPSEVFMISSKNIGIYLPPSPKRGGGGGGGDRSPQPASKGKPPKVSLKQLAPPAAKIRNEQPKLAVEPTVIAPPELYPTTNLGQFGDVLANIAPPSNGPGYGGGFGNGGGGGTGPGSGPGIGPGSGGGAGGDVFGVGNGVIAPRIIRKVNPEYSDEARKAKHQGTVILYVEIDTDGNIRKIEVRIGLGLGLDEKAVGAIKQWKFSPGTKNGQPVIVGAIVEIIFRLL